MYQSLWRPSQVFPNTRGYLHWWRNCHKTELPARGFVWIVHGMGEHGFRYNEFATYLTQFGFDVLAPDLPGHGMSAKEGGQKRLASFDEMLAEIEDAYLYWIQQGPIAKRGLAHTPWYLLGHSMGALLSLCWIVRGKREGADYEFARRAFISAPPLRVRMPVPAWKVKLAQMLEKVTPDLRISNGISADGLSYDVVNVEAYKTDPLVHGYASPRLYNSLVLAAETVLARPAEIEIPICFGVGADDPIVDPTAIKEYYALLGTHKKLIEFPHMKHEILNELGREKVYEAVASWWL